jgi:hypothetical protein
VELRDRENGSDNVILYSASEERKFKNRELRIWEVSMARGVIL